MFQIVRNVIYQKDKSTQKGTFRLDNYVMNKALVTTCLDKYFPTDLVDNVMLEYLPDQIFTIDKDETLSDFERQPSLRKKSRKRSRKKSRKSSRKYGNRNKSRKSSKKYQRRRNDSIKSLKNTT